MLFPIDSAESYLRKFATDLKRQDNVLSWLSGGGVSMLIVKAIDYKTHDGLLVSEEVLLMHFNRSFVNISIEEVSECNKWGTLSALMPSNSDDPAHFVSKVGIFSTPQLN